MMNVKHLTSLLLLASSTCFGQTAQCDISGTWKHADKNAWLNVDLSKKQVIVENHLDNPKANGLSVIKNLSLDTDSTTSWQGQMYDATTNDYVLVRFSFAGCNKLNVLHNQINILTLIKE